MESKTCLADNRMYVSLYSERLLYSIYSVLIAYDAISRFIQIHSLSLFTTYIHPHPSNTLLDSRHILKVVVVEETVGIVQVNHFNRVKRVAPGTLWRWFHGVGHESLFKCRRRNYVHFFKHCSVGGGLCHWLSIRPGCGIRIKSFTLVRGRSSMLHSVFVE